LCCWGALWHLTFRFAPLRKSRKGLFGMQVQFQGSTVLASASSQAAPGSIAQRAVPSLRQKRRAHFGGLSEKRVWLDSIVTAPSSVVERATGAQPLLAETTGLCSYIVPPCSLRLARRLRLGASLSERVPSPRQKRRAHFGGLSEKRAWLDSIVTATPLRWLSEQTGRSPC
jgi:hypothetical protein